MSGASRIRHRLTLQQQSLTPDGAGGFTRTWQNVADLWGEIRPATGREKLEAMQLQAAVTHRVTLRYRAGVTAAMRLLYENRSLNIRVVLNRGERDRWLDILAEEGAAS